MALFPRLTAMTAAAAAATLLVAASAAAADGANYCGTTFDAAAASCARPCPAGVNSECGVGETCYAAVPCAAKWCGSTWAAASACRRPCPGNTDTECGPGEGCYSDVTCDGASSPPRAAPGTKWCGTSWEAASSSCRLACPGNTDTECGPGEGCYSDVVCGGAVTPPAAPGAGASGTNWCGSSWTAASASCSRACPGNTDTECGPGEGCYSDVACGGAPAAPAPGAPGAAEAVRLGYFASWSTGDPCWGFSDTSLRAVASRYTHLAWSFAAVGPDGRLVPATAGDPARWRAFNVAVKAAAPSLHTALAVGGWSFNDGATATRWSDMATSPAARAAFASSSVSALRAAGFDGLDIDWEFPAAADRGGRPADKANLVALVAGLRAAFDAASGRGGARLGLTIAIPASAFYDGGFDLPALARHVDWFNLMSYDLATGGDVTGAHTGMTRIRASVARVRAAGVPAAQIVLGTAAYGRTWTLADGRACAAAGGRACAVTGAGRPGGCSAEAGYLSDREIAAAAAAAGAAASSGVVDGSAWTILPGDQYVSHDTAATLGVKRAFAREARLRGTMVWSVDQVL
ncbi:hypothetical protein I4F81_012563 [Pyropia yezoensis]|uniref:Uncharacterized protein n=1 Tax=Pyropia yezoensis TaxID=2788 RepID=A0ACC3CJG0_PYRYE|nr:hypothetical protein I4F81_012563 [Neopyropia yezoensis]